MKCRSGKHDWLNETSAQRCCDPNWRLELRFGPSDIQPGDATDVVIPVHGLGGMVKVWNRVEQPA